MNIDEYVGISPLLYLDSVCLCGSWHGRELARYILTSCVSYFRAEQL